MNKLKKIGKGILGGATIAVGAAVGLGTGFLQVAAEELIADMIDKLF